MLKAIVVCPRENQIVRAKLVDILEALHGWLVNERPAVMRQCDLVINDVVDCLCLG